MRWEKGHGRLERRRLKRVSVSPEEIGLCGAWQVIAVRRQRVPLSKRGGPASDEVWYYVTSLGPEQMGDEELLEAIRAHWDAIENGSHHRRDVSFGEDASRVSHRGSAQIMAALRNLALGIYELEKAHRRTQAQGAKSQSRRMTVSAALALLGR